MRTLAAQQNIVGRGTWLDLTALRIIEREQSLGRKPKVIRTESGLGASGIPHIGNMSDAVRAYGVSLALEEQGEKTEFIAFADDLDGLRKVPAGLPEWLREHLGRPVTSIPDPLGNCHGSYGEHMSWLLLEALDRVGIKYTAWSAREAYKLPEFIEQLRKILSSAKRVGEIVLDEVEQEKFTEVLPYFPICEKCGRVYTTKAYAFDEKNLRVAYTCDGEMQVQDESIKGCGHKGEVDIRSGQGKLSWKAEFAMRWAALQINFEAYGKELIDSVRVNDRICEEVLGYPAPYHITFEHFLDRGGRKLAKSTGNILAPQVWLRYGSPQTLLLLMFKRIVGARTLSVDDVPVYMTELDQLEDAYFERKTPEDAREVAKLRGLYEYCWLLKPPKEPEAHVPYNLLVYLAKVAPTQAAEEYIAGKLREYGYLKGEFTNGLRERVQYARNWAEDFEEIQESKIILNEPHRSAIQELITIIRKESDETILQNSVFEVAKRHGIQPADFFRMLYLILLGAPKGPRLGPYIKAMGMENVEKALERALQPSQEDK